MNLARGPGMFHVKHWIAHGAPEECLAGHGLIGNASGDRYVLDRYPGFETGTVGGFTSRLMGFPCPLCFISALA